MYAYCENNSLNNIDSDGSTWYYWSWRRYGSVYYAAVKFFYWWYSPTFTFTIKNGIVSLPFAEKRSSNYYPVNSNYWNFLWLLGIGDTYALAHAIYTVSKSISWKNLYGRSIHGINTELILHFIAFQFGVKRSSSYAAELGSLFRFGNGYDGNAWVFESVYYIILTYRFLGVRSRLYPFVMALTWRF